jgi:hypothetical protein
MPTVIQIEGGWEGQAEDGWLSIPVYHNSGTRKPELTEQSKKTEKHR